MSKMVIAIPEIKANLTCVYKRYNATPICKGKLKREQGDETGFRKFMHTRQDITLVKGTM